MEAFNVLNLGNFLIFIWTTLNYLFLLFKIPGPLNKSKKFL